jgi:hypothetical protein
MNAGTQDAPLNEKHLAHAIIATIYQWEEPRYHADLRQGGGTTITGSEETFQWFLGEWRVARNLRKEFHNLVRNYLNTTLRTQLKSNPGNPKIIDDAAEHIRQQGWSSLINKDARDKKHRLPVSLVSKVGFFICPGEIVPCDSDARNGLNVLLGQAGKIPTNSSYEEYYQAFQANFKKHRKSIEAELKKEWVTTLTDKLLGSLKDLNTLAFKQKVFDNYLLERGRA